MNESGRYWLLDLPLRIFDFSLFLKWESYSQLHCDKEEVIREIPPKKMLDMYAEMADFMGLLVNKRI